MGKQIRLMRRRSSRLPMSSVPSVPRSLRRAYSNSKNSILSSSVFSGVGVPAHNSHHVSIMLWNMFLASGNEPKSPALCNLHNLIWMKLTWLGSDNDNIGQLGGLPIYTMFRRALYYNIIQIHSNVLWD